MCHCLLDPKTISFFLNADKVYYYYYHHHHHHHHYYYYQMSKLE